MAQPLQLCHFHSAQLNILCIKKYLTDISSIRTIILSMSQNCRQPRNRRGRYVGGAAPEPEEIRPAGPPVEALEQLAFIRSTMENAGSFTAVPGRGQMLIGLTALVAAYVASIQATPERWLLVWMAESAVALAIAAVAIPLKAKRTKQSLWSGPARKFVLSFTPPMVVGALLTGIMFTGGMAAAIPAMWLMLYGTAVIAGGAFSTGIVPVMGLCFLTLGAVATVTPASWTNWEMALGFGALHVLFGGIISRRHGG